MQKANLVIGAGGNIGREIVKQLLSIDDYCVIASTRGNDVQGVDEQLDRIGAKIYSISDITEQDVSIEYFNNISKYYFIKNVIYSVGHCPAGGFAEEIKYPLSEMSMDRYWNEIKMHQIGPLNVFQTMLKNLVDGGSFTFISSAITRIPEFPPFMHPYHHVSVIAAEDELIKGMRHDSAVKERNIKIHRIAPGAVDTPFHSTGPKPPSGYVSTKEVANAVTEAIQGDEEVDRQILPQSK